MPKKVLLIGTFAVAIAVQIGAGTVTRDLQVDPPHNDIAHKITGINPAIAEVS